uniref:Regulator of G-protein signaling 8 n=1 Tax=Electrophorus electricus TaxID=8005 RepID=A0AAY5E978_ELEEL
MVHGLSFTVELIQSCVHGCSSALLYSPHCLVVLDFSFLFFFFLFNTILSFRSRTTKTRLRLICNVEELGSRSIHEITKWADSFDVLLSNKYGLAMFRALLKTEFSDENIEFWLTCKDYKKIKSPVKLVSKANKIYKEFIDVQAPREVNIDFRTRQETRQKLLEPTFSSLNEVQVRVYSLMEKDSYPWFLRSKIYQDLLNRTQMQCQRKSF